MRARKPAFPARRLCTTALVCAATSLPLSHSFPPRPLTSFDVELPSRPSTQVLSEVATPPLAHHFKPSVVPVPSFVTVGSERSNAQFKADSQEVTSVVPQTAELISVSVGYAEEADRTSTSEDAGFLRFDEPFSDYAGRAHMPSENLHERAFVEPAGEVDQIFRPHLSAVSVPFAQTYIPDAAPLPSTISRKRSTACPSGYELINHTCVRQELLPANLICPAGTREISGECATFAEPTWICADGSEPVDNLCFRRIERPPISFCQGPNQLLEEANQTCRIILDQPLLCPEGFTLDPERESCVRVSSPQQACPEGFESINARDGTLECVRKTVYRAIASCSLPDYTLDSSSETCARVFEPPAYCPDKFVKTNNGTCILQTPHIAGPCPPGYTALADRCSVEVQRPAEPSCDHGFALDLDTLECVKKISVPATCPIGAIRGPLGLCEEEVIQQFVCEPHEILDKETCRETVLSSPELVCPADFSLFEGRCKRIERVEAMPTCNKGHLSPDKSFCVVETTSLPLIECPEDFQLTKGFHCTREVEYKCPDTVVSTECELPPFATVPGPMDFPPEVELVHDYKRKEDRLRGFTAAVAAAAQRDKAARCADVHRVVEHSCKRLETRNIIHTCGPGAILRGKECVSATRYPVLQFTCPTGYNYHRGTGQCVNVTSQPAQTVCPPHTVLRENGNGEFTGEPVCVETRSRRAQLACNNGSVPRHIQTSQVHAFSTSETFPNEPEQDLAPLDSMDHLFAPHACVLYTLPTEKPDIELRQKPQLICPFGQKVHDRCTVIESIRRPAVCPSGFFEQRGLCLAVKVAEVPQPVVVQQPVVYVCPHDGTSTLNEHTCVQTEIAAPIDVCPVESAGELLGPLSFSSNSMFVDYDVPRTEDSFGGAPSDIYVRGPSPAEISENRSVYFTSVSEATDGLLPFPEYENMQDHYQLIGHSGLEYGVPGTDHEPSGPEFRLSGPEYEFSGPEYEFSGPEYEFSGPEYEFSGPEYQESPFGLSDPEYAVTSLDYRLSSPEYEPWNSEYEPWNPEYETIWPEDDEDPLRLESNMYAESGSLDNYSRGGELLPYDRALQETGFWTRKKQRPRRSFREGPTLEGDRCIERVNAVRQPARRISVAAQLRCEDEEFELKGERCVKTNIYKPVSVCDPPYIRYKDNQCVKSVNREPQCPSGSELIEDYDFEYITGPDEREIGFDIGGSRSFVSSKCVKSISIAPTVTEVRVCTKGAPGC